MKKRISVSLLTLLLTGIGQLSANAQALESYTVTAVEIASAKPIEIGISGNTYEYLNLFGGSTVQAKLTVPSGFTLAQPPATTWYSISTPTGNEYTITVTKNELLSKYRKSKALMLFGISGMGKSNLIRYVQTNSIDNQSLTPGAINNVIVELDMCPEADQPLNIRSRTGVRKWLFVKNSESITFRARNVNPTSSTISVSGALIDLVPAAGGSILDITKKADSSSTSATVGADMSNLTAAEGAIRSFTAILPNRVNEVNSLSALVTEWTSEPCFDADHTLAIWKGKILVVTQGSSVPKHMAIIKNDLKSLETAISSFTFTGTAADDFKKTANKQLTMFQKQLNDDVLNDLEKRIIEISRSLQNTVVSSLPITVNGSNSDVVRFTVDKTQLNSSAKTTATYDVYINGGLKIDVSGGLFVNGLVDYSYVGKEAGAESTSATAPATGTATSPTRYQPIQETADKVAFGLGTLIHAYPRWNLFQGSLNLGVSVGASVGTKVNYYAGISALLGRQQRIVFSAGLAWGKVKRLSSLYEIDEKNPKFYAVTGGQFTTRDVIEHTLFFSFTYNLTANRAASAVK